MAFQPRNSGQQPLAEINMIPLIDVMLVLLIVFIVAAPLLTHAVKVDLPRASSVPNREQPENIQLSLDYDGGIFWNGLPVAEAELENRMRLAAGQVPQPELHIHADGKTPYEALARIMATSARAGLGRVGFVSEPVRN